MTRSLETVAAKPASDKASLLKPLRAPRNLAAEVVKRIAGEIRDGRLKAGERLPTEQELMDALGVSRTVIREAVAALRADGLVTTRQGSGAYVASDGRQVPFRLQGDGLESINDVVDVMELRVAIEVEAAGLAADRAGAHEARLITQAHTAIEAAITRGEPAVAEDLAFHRSIAKATGNQQFEAFLGFLGHQGIPRQSIRLTHASTEENRAYLVRIQQEHTRILEAIRAGDSGEARRAMRAHLARALQRYRGLSERARAGL